MWPEPPEGEGEYGGGGGAWGKWLGIMGGCEGGGSDDGGGGGGDGQTHQ